MMNTTLTGTISKVPYDKCCNFMRCMTCPYKNCETGQQARNHGRKAYDAVIRELEESWSQYRRERK